LAFWTETPPKITTIAMMKSSVELMYVPSIAVPEFPRPGVKDCLDTIDFLDTKIHEMDNEIKILASNDKYAIEEIINNESR
jgi:hypothetical protein